MLDIDNTTSVVDKCEPDGADTRTHVGGGHSHRHHASTPQEVHPSSHC